MKVFNADLKHRFRMPTRVVNLMQLIFCSGRFMMLLRVVLGISLSGAYTSGKSNAIDILPRSLYDATKTGLGDISYRE